MKKVFMIVHELDVNKGGMTTAMLTRSKVFYDNKIAGNIVTFDYKFDYPEIIQALKKSRKMDERTEMLNPFDFYKAKADQSKNKRNPTLYKAIDQLLKGTVEIKESQSVSRYFNQKTGEYVSYKKSFENTSFLDIFENNKRIKRIYYREEKIQKIDVFNHENKLIAEQFFDSKCYLYLYRQINAKNGSVGQTYLINEKKQFKNNVGFCTYFLDELVKDDKKNIMICDGPGSFPKMLATRHKAAKKFAVIHINHHKNFDNSGAVKEKEDYILKNAQKIAGVICLTEAQNRDIIKEYQIDNVSVISNFINITDQIPETTHRKVVGHISRLVPQKGLPYLIEVAKEVVEKDNEIEFHIYGDGEEKNKLERLIRENELEKNVKLLGYTDNATDKIKDFGCVVSTSQFEGQGLSIIEAMLLEKPVIAFDIKYGPSDFIRHEENGYLIENQNISGMADKILKVINDEALAKQYGKESRKTIIELYHSEKLMEKWDRLFNGKVLA
ncbi:hypothetical protein HMPREF1208_01809 [Staphylococcus sp. HGB0015]|uniref:Glycosyl transferase family 1 n=1 Tax=Staphylococcus schleiferi TaxID=1295 RepID=A0ABX0FZE7_STASC|nr:MULTISPECIES: glycosyltransferase [Staphylococcus]QGS46333.1 glycosyltransferase [Mammaliicoccus fleurettii]EPD49032.1 hypothetical protein HMPREF1208_01809 [Staphylococcus sp. HGB0015]NHA33929.1 glycosyl transferase family 1 [Staphylococcus schleiferi]NHA38366.1 glycosyl transferase family 1 [Staphylococcus schleiferi]NHA40592.1 glycosyl transferase family 1 [Staphylococcus schleiferi]